jgi:calcium-dependent protein kinase
VFSEPFNGLKFVDYSTIAENPSEEVIKSIAIQILRGLAYSHSQGHLLKSLSITNIIFFKGANSTVMLKLIAFGVQEKTDHPYSSLKSQYVYKAPEALDGQYTGKADVWSCGVVLYILVTNAVPFEGQNAEQFSRAMQGRPGFQGKFGGNLIGICRL